MTASAKSIHSHRWLSRLIVALTISLLMLSLFAASAFASGRRLCRDRGRQRGTHRLDEWRGEPPSTRTTMRTTRTRTTRKAAVAVAAACRRPIPRRS